MSDDVVRAGPVTSARENSGEGRRGEERRRKGNGLRSSGRNVWRERREREEREAITGRVWGGGREGEGKEG